METKKEHRIIIRETFSSMNVKDLSVIQHLIDDFDWLADTTFLSVKTGTFFESTRNMIISDLRLAIAHLERLSSFDKCD